MSTKQRFGLFFVAAIIAVIFAVPAAKAARVVPPVGNLHLVSGDANQAKIAWETPSTSNLGNATIDEYIIRRNGHRIATLQGFSGIVDTSYIDGSPSLRKATYAVTAVDSEGRRSPPATLDVPAPQGVLPAPKSPSGVKDGVQSSDFCRAIIPPNIRGHNQPTAFEKYGCGKGMNSLNESDPSKVNLLIVHTSVPRPIHDGIQTVMQFLVTVGQEFFLLLSAMSIWVMQATTYLGIASLFAGIIEAFHGDPSFKLIFSIVLMLGLGSLAMRLWKEEHREGYQGIGIIIAAMAAITLLASSPNHWMRNFVNWPLSGYTAIENGLGGITNGRSVTAGYNLTVHPTYSGDKTNAAVRKQEELDYLMFQYLPHCATNFQDYQWSMSTYVPGERITFCERFVQIWDGDNDKQKDDFKKAVEKENKGNADFFQGKSQLTQALYIGLSKLTLAFHGLMEFVRNMSVLGCEILLLGIYLISLLILLNAVVDRDSSRWTLQQWWMTMLQLLKVPAAMLGITLIQTALEARILTPQDNMGFLFAEFAVFCIDVVLLVAMIWVLRRMHQSYKEKMEARKSYREQSSLSWGKVATAAALGTGAAGVATAGAGVAARGANNFRKWLLQSDDDQEVPSDMDGRNDDFIVPQLPLLESGPTNGYSDDTSDDPQTPDNGSGGQYFDAEAFAEPITDDWRLLEATTGRQSEQSTPESEPSPYTVNGTAVADPSFDGFDSELITDAEVVDDNSFAVPDEIGGTGDNRS
jgi:hypothetical protein